MMIISDFEKFIENANIAKFIVKNDVLSVEHDQPLWKL